MKKITMIMAGLLLVPVVALGVSAMTGVTDVSAIGLSEALNSTQVDSMAKDISDPNSLVTTVVNLMLWLVGILAVIMLIWGGVKYATSGGDSNKVQSAKNTILYAVIGLIVAIFSWAIVSWVVSEFGS